jgi:hypothetical protein
MKRRFVALGILSLAFMLVAPPASADNTVSATDDGQRLDLKITPDTFGQGTISGAICHATNHRVPTQNAKFILASVICEYRDGTGTWRIFAGGCCYSSSREDNDNSGSAHTPDSGASNLCSILGDGNYPMRARGDGYWIGYNNVRHDFRDNNRLFTTSPYPVAHC